MALPPSLLSLDITAQKGKMKKKLLLVCVAFLCLHLYVNIPNGHTYSTTPPINRTGAPGQNSCTSCHGSGSTTAVNFAWDNGNPAEYIPGNTYDLSIEIVHPSQQRFGFSMISWDSSNNYVGDWIGAGGNTQVYSSGNYVGHQNAPSGQSGSYQYDLQWTAPAAGTGDVTFYTGCVAANGNGNTQGDEGKDASFSITEAMPVSGGTSVDLKLFLEGSYQGNGTMTNGAMPFLPNASPYDGPPFNATTFTATNIPADAVDWVLVESRTGSPNALPPRGTVLKEAISAFVLTDGQIVDQNSQALSFNLIAGEEYHFAVRHRNHIGALSAASFVAGTTGIVYDFTTSEQQAFGIEQLKMMSDGAFALFAGDYNQDNTVQNTDYDEWFVDPAIVNTYSLTDGNLDGNVQTSDYDTWFLNKAKLGHHELGF